MVSRGEGWGVRDNWLRTLLTRTIVEFSIQTLGLIGVLNPSSLFAGVPDKSISIRANICTILSILLGPITMLLNTHSQLTGAFDVAPLVHIVSYISWCN